MYLSPPVRSITPAVAKAMALPEVLTELRDRCYHRRLTVRNYTTVVNQIHAITRRHASAILTPEDQPVSWRANDVKFKAKALELFKGLDFDVQGVGGCYAPGSDDELDMIGSNPAQIHAMPFILALRPIERAREVLEQRIAVLASQTPVALWWDGTRGCSLKALGLLLGETGDLNNYAGPAKLWKRMGLAVIGGEAQRKCVDADKAVIHGFNPTRRAMMHVLGDVLMKSGGPFREVYDQRKGYLQQRALAEGKQVVPAADIPQGDRSGYVALGAIHGGALRYMEKHVLKELWRQWRMATGMHGVATTQRHVDDVAA